MKMFNPLHPGVLVKEYLGDATVTEAARLMQVSRVTLQRIVNCKAGISADVAYRLGLLLGTSPDLWFNMQKNYEMHIASKIARPQIKRLIQSDVKSIPENHSNQNIKLE